jgi:hypothetical protein
MSFANLAGNIAGVLAPYVVYLVRSRSNSVLITVLQKYSSEQITFVFQINNFLILSRVYGCVCVCVCEDFYIIRYNVV